MCAAVWVGRTHVCECALVCIRGRTRVKVCKGVGGRRCACDGAQLEAPEEPSWGSRCRAPRGDAPTPAPRVQVTKGLRWTPGSWGWGSGKTRGRGAFLGGDAHNSRRSHRPARERCAPGESARPTRELGGQDPKPNPRQMRPKNRAQTGKEGAKATPPRPPSHPTRRREAGRGGRGEGAEESRRRAGHWEALPPPPTTGALAAAGYPIPREHSCPSRRGRVPTRRRPYPLRPPFPRPPPSPRPPGAGVSPPPPRPRPSSCERFCAGRPARNPGGGEAAPTRLGGRDPRPHAPRSA